MPPFEDTPIIASSEVQAPSGSRKVGGNLRPEIGVSCLYVVLGTAWIIGSDAWLNRTIHGDPLTIFVHAFKGLNFVVTTGILLYLVLRRSFGGWRKSEELRISLLEASRLRFKNLSRRVEELQEQERTRIAREIHDELGQYLTGLKMRIRLIEDRLAEKGDRSLNSFIDDLVEASDMVDEIIDAVRRISFGLRPAALDDLGLAAAIDEETSQFASRTAIECKLEMGQMDEELPPAVETAAFRIFQESITNVARHSQAKSMKIECGITDHVLRLTVQDDGVGMDSTGKECVDSLGLLGMLERAQDVGGNLVIQSAKGRGTKVTLVIPLSSKKPFGYQS